MQQHTASKGIGDYRLLYHNKWVYYIVFPPALCRSLCQNISRSMKNPRYWWCPTIQTPLPPLHLQIIVSSRPLACQPYFPPCYRINIHLSVHIHLFGLLDINKYVQDTLFNFFQAGYSFQEIFTDIFTDISWYLSYSPKYLLFCKKNTWKIL